VERLQNHPQSCQVQNVASLLTEALISVSNEIETKRNALLINQNKATNSAGSYGHQGEAIVLEAGALPVASVAALMSVDALDPSEGERLLVVGATGGTGSYAVQRTFSLEEATSGLDAFQREHVLGKFAISVAAAS
jgi:hypothetical protein